MELSHFNAKQKVVLKQFREAVNDCKLPDSDDTYLARWLIVQDFNLKKAERMLRKSLEWRQQYHIDTIQEDFKPPEVLTKFYAAGFVGQDKLRNPIWIIRDGRIDLKGILRSTKKKNYQMYVIQMMEEIISKVRKNPTNYKRAPDSIVRVTLIVDLEGFSLADITYKPGVEAVCQLIQLQEANYPEFQHHVFLINAPNIFSVASSIIKPFLHEKTRNKIRIFSHDQKQWKAAILAEVDPEELPVCYGGILTDPDGNPNCTTLVNMGGKIPSFYYANDKPDIVNKEQLNIPQGSKKLVDFQVENIGGILKWNFHSEENDIGFAVYRKNGSELVPIVPHDRVECYLHAEEGEIRCEKPGVYVVEFDNSFSYLRSKRIWYSITIVSASQNI